MGLNSWSRCTSSWEWKAGKSLKTIFSGSEFRNLCEKRETGMSESGDIKGTSEGNTMRSSAAPGMRSQLRAATLIAVTAMFFHRFWGTAASVCKRVLLLKDYSCQISSLKKRKKCSRFIHWWATPKNMISVGGWCFAQVRVPCFLEGFRKLVSFSGNKERAFIKRTFSWHLKKLIFLVCYACMGICPQNGFRACFQARNHFN